MSRPILLVKLFLFAYLGYLFWFLLTSEGPAAPAYNPPFVLWVLDTINLFIHEAGHLFLRPFGMFIHIIGGSFFQCFTPLALLVVTWRQNVSQIAYPAFWFGENLVNVSYYIQDAPYRKLKLIARGLIHDWGWLLAGRKEMAAPLSQVVFWVGILICVAAIGVGIYYAIRDYKEASAFS
ncbi:MAG: hypothetical protein ACKVRP_08590 [Bacteroidota bacterium]